MKKFIILNGAMGVGKTRISKELNKKLVNSVWLDGDWCMMMNPLGLLESNRKMFLDNLYHLLNNYLANPSFDYVLFSWVIPTEDMIRYLLKKLSVHSFSPVRITLLCGEDQLRERMLLDGRDAATIEASLQYQEAFKEQDTVKVDTTGLSVAETTQAVLKLIMDPRS